MKLLSAVLVALSVAMPSVAERAVAEMITAEAPNAPFVCKVALAAVVFNRVRSDEYPNDPLSVLADFGEFSLSGEYTDDALDAVIAAESGLDPTNGAVRFAREPVGEAPLFAADGLFFYR